ncbi:MAG: hypothetical protein M3R54_02660 [Chloroflexota bacterium]|nr:hypothetical protein [Chloroflexota bacterium]
MPAKKTIAVSLERGDKRTFATSVEWPGWARVGRDDASALQALFDCAPRYARVVAGTRLGFSTPTDLSALTVVERHAGNATTDFGAPAAELNGDSGRLAAAELVRLRTLIGASWRAFDEATRAAKGKTLAKGPRGGGRPLDQIARHVRDAEAGYLSALGAPFRADPKATFRAELERTRAAVLEGIGASARGDFPAQGPRGGKRWTARFFARRLAWHALDHAWEIEDRSLS